MLAECFTAETLTQVQPDWKCLIYKRKKKSFKRFFFLFLKLLNSGSATPVGMKEENGKLLVGWAEVLHLLNGVLLPLCNVIPHEHGAWCTPEFQGCVSCPALSSGRSSAAGDHYWLEAEQAPLVPAHVAWPVASPSPFPLGRHRLCLGPLSNALV